MVYYEDGKYANKVKKYENYFEILEKTIKMEIDEERITDTLDKLLASYDEIAEKVRMNIEKIKSEICKEKTKYATNFDGIGLFSPSLIQDKITSGYRKGKLLNNKPNKEQYKICYFNEKNEILCIEHCSKSDDITYYFFREGNITYAVPFCGNTTYLYPYYIYCIEYEGDRLKSIARIDNVSSWYKEYTYESKNEVICYNYYYVPKTDLGNWLMPQKLEITMKDNKVDTLYSYSADGTLQYVYERKRKK